MKQLEASLLQKHPPAEVRQLLDPFATLAHDRASWDHTLDGLAVLGGPGLFRVFRMQRPVPELAVVADSFHTKPLRRFLQGKAIMGDQVGRSWLRPETIATMPGMYQLLPHPDRTWMLDTRGARIDLDLYDVAVWQRYEWSIWNPLARERVRVSLADPRAADTYLARFEGEFARQLERAKRFHRALSRPIAKAPTRFVVFGSACVPTAAHCVLEEIDGMVSIALLPSDIRKPVPGIPYEELMIEPGDGAVTKASLLARDSLRIDAGRSDFPIA